MSDYTERTFTGGERGFQFTGPVEPVNEFWIKTVEDLFSKGGVILDVGCGAYKIHPNLVGVDAYSDDPNVDVKALMWDMPFGDNTVDGIICWQTLEHVSKYFIYPTLKEFARVLRPGGRMLLLVPDLEFVVRMWLKTKTNGYDMDQIFGLQNGEGQEHKTGFTQDIFAGYIQSVPELQLIGFVPVKAYSQLNIGAIVDKREPT